MEKSKKTVLSYLNITSCFNLAKNTCDYLSIYRVSSFALQHVKLGYFSKADFLLRKMRFQRLTCILGVAVAYAQLVTAAPMESKNPLNKRASTYTQYCTPNDLLALQYAVNEAKEMVGFGFSPTACITRLKADSYSFRLRLREPRILGIGYRTSTTVQTSILQMSQLYSSQLPVPLRPSLAPCGTAQVPLRTAMLCSACCLFIVCRSCKHCSLGP